MTVGKKLTIALAVAIPLLILGSGLAMAAGGEPNLTTGDRYAAPAYAVTPIATAATVATACDGCTGPCQGNGSGLCSGSGDGNCPGSGSCIGQCSGIGTCAGNCGNAALQAAGCLGRAYGCGQRLGAQSGKACNGFIAHVFKPQGMYVSDGMYRRFEGET